MQITWLLNLSRCSSFLLNKARARKGCNLRQWRWIESVTLGLVGPLDWEDGGGRRQFHHRVKDPTGTGNKEGDGFSVFKISGGSGAAASQQGPIKRRPRVFSLQAQATRYTRDVQKRARWVGLEGKGGGGEGDELRGRTDGTRGDGRARGAAVEPR